jgi:2-polyprenyl-3-methyl-5-hydroxy-6-metoxy-1,4-benzoquinol methylase
VLRTEASDDELRELRGALARLADADPGGFERLFAPGVPRGRVAPALPDVVPSLRAFGLVEGEPDSLWGLHRIRRIADRFYALELAHDEPEYVQDVWPETDALLARLDGAPPGRLLDLGTGCGVVGIEAARRGHHVVATDLYPSALALARFNARLNDVTLELALGHLYDAVGDARFDCILTAPHYGRTFDQLRLEVLCGSLSHLSPRGTLVLATALEWEEGAPLGVESALALLVAAGATVAVAPIDDASKRGWFTVAVSAEPVPRLVSRHRFTVAVTATAGPGALRIERPARRPGDEVAHVPLARLAHRPHAVAAIVDGEDLAALRRLLGVLEAPDARLEAPPVRLLDACRFGERACARAAGAILDAAGDVRPCTHGGALARVDTTLRALADALAAEARAAEVRRGCAHCPAQPVCSRCLFPGPLDEPAYCALMRAHADALPRLHRLLDALQRLRWPPGPLRLRRWPRVLDGEAPDPALARDWDRCQAWILDGEGGYALAWLDAAGARCVSPVASSTAAVGAWLAGGGDGPLPPRLVERERVRLRALFSRER